MLLKIASRKSDLARLQSYTVAQALKQAHNQTTELKVEFLFSASFGDKNPDISLTQMPAKGVFTEDLQKGLQEKNFDMVVHSWKDLPTDLSADSLIFTLKREDPRDVIFFRKENINAVKESRAISILTSSPRRSYHIDSFLRSYLPFPIDEVKCLEVRGNIPTRLRKLEQGQGDALIMAKAALDRLMTAQQEEFQELKENMKGMLARFDFMVLPLALFPTAAAQGALAIEVHKDNEKVKELLSKVHCEQTYKHVKKERELLKSFGGGCHQKLGMSSLPLHKGDYFSASGESHSGEKIRRLEFVQRSDAGVIKTFDHHQSFPSLKGKTTKFFNRHFIHSTGESDKINKRNLYITKEHALPQKAKPAGYVWASGLVTWKKLAQRGQWVHGSSESLGENFGTHIEHLAGEKLSWLKLTHDQSNNITQECQEYLEYDDHYEHQATYSLSAKEMSEEELSQLKATQNFYWMSASQFLAAKEILGREHLKQAQHSCGAGTTFDVITKELGHPPFIFLNQYHWHDFTVKQ